MAKGIDLGTSNSCIATLDVNGNPKIIENLNDASDTLASAIYFEGPDADPIVGNCAKEYVETDGANVVQFFKREIGKEDQFPPHTIFSKEYTPLDLSAIVLKRLKEMAEEQGEEVNDVVITCPAYFGPKEREITKKAGEIAGLNVLDLINEPTAAALSYCAREFQEEKTILVYDLGGGTFDVTIMKMFMDTNENGDDIQRVKIIATGGDDLLGGKDWDDRLYKKIRNKVAQENGLGESELDVDTRQTIYSKVETTKHKLSHVPSATVKVSVDGQMTKVDITREEFEDLTKDLVDKTMTYVDETLKNASQKTGESIHIDTVLLVGGSTFMSMIYEAVKSRFGDIVRRENPNKAVAYGAAIYSNMLVDIIEEEEDNIHKDNNSFVPSYRKFVIEDVASRSFGPGILYNNDKDYLIDNLYKEGTPLDKVVKRTYYTVSDYQTSILFRVFENLSQEDRCVPCLTEQGDPQETDPKYAVKYLGELELPLSGHTKRGAPIDVEFTVKNIGIVIKATDPDTGNSKEVTIRYEGGLTEEEFEQKKEEMKRVTPVSR